VQDYAGEVKVRLRNHGGSDYQVKAHDRIAQLIVEQIVEPVVRLVAELDASVRSDGGFGSTGR
jgi:dUTP pyrophosphatase